LSYLVGIEGKRRSPRPPCQNSLPSLLLRPPTPSPTPNGWTPSCWPPSLTPPCRDSTSHPTPAQDIAMATEDARSRQSATNHPLHCHLATSLALEPWTNSTSQFYPRSTVRRTPTVPDRCCRAVQNAQRVPAIPVRLDPARPCSSHSRARQPALDAMPPPPCPLADRTNPDKPGFRHARTEPKLTPTEPSHHRHQRLHH
jgi:hypothetical protein